MCLCVHTGVHLRIEVFVGPEPVLDAQSSSLSWLISLSHCLCSDLNGMLAHTVGEAVGTMDASCVSMAAISDDAFDAPADAGTTVALRIGIEPVFGCLAGGIDPSS